MEDEKQREPQNEIQAFIVYLGTKISLGDKQPALEYFSRLLRGLAPALGMSLRDVERAYLSFIVWVPFPNLLRNLIDAYACALSLRLLDFDLYDRICRRDSSVLPRFDDVLTALVAGGEVDDELVGLFNLMVRAHVSRTATPEMQQKWKELGIKTDIEIHEVWDWVTVIQP